jgi:hypothetical protein
LIDFIYFDRFYIFFLHEPLLLLSAVAYPGILFGWVDSTNSVEDRGQRERESGGGSPLVRGSAQFANE